ncbi:MAG: hypothetical protein ACR2FG_07775 [Marmoricola sp.]
MIVSLQVFALLALASAVVGVVVLVWRALPTGGGFEWPRQPEVADSHDQAPDTRLRTLERIVTGHLEARIPNDLLAVQLRELADRRLGLRHGFRLDAEPERAAALLGPDLLMLLDARPPRRLTLAQVNDTLRRIEAL